MDDLRERFERLRTDLDRQRMPDLRPSANRPEQDWRPTTQSLGARIAIVVGALAIALGALTFVWSAFRNDENTVQPGPAAETSALWALSRGEDQSGPPEVWLYTIDPVDGDTRLIADLKETTYAALSPNGRDIVFTQVGQDRGLWITDVDGRKPERLYQATPNNVFNPAWSPDGNQIVFGNNRKGHDELFLIRPDGSGLRQLTTNEEGGDFFPSWSADGSQIAFVRNAGGPIGLYRVDVETGDVQVVANPLGATESAWSPDGRSIVVSVAGVLPPGTEAVPALHDLYRVDIATGDQTALTDTLGADERSPVFSTDGTLAYVLRSGDSFVVSSGQGTASANSQPFGEPGELVQLGWYTLEDHGTTAPASEVTATACFGYKVDIYAVEDGQTYEGTPGDDIVIQGVDSTYRDNGGLDVICDVHGEVLSLSVDSHPEFMKLGHNELKDAVRAVIDAEPASPAGSIPTAEEIVAGQWPLGSELADMLNLSLVGLADGPCRAYFGVEGSGRGYCLDGLPEGGASELDVYVTGKALQGHRLTEVELATARDTLANAGNA